MKGFFCLIVFCLAFPLFCCNAQQTDKSSVSDVSQAPLSNTVTITGWFCTIWGDSETGESSICYSITDDQGQTTTLLLEEGVAKPLGGLMEINNKRVTIVGELTSESPRTVHVLSIKFADTD